jgi:outer membrane lipoprotein-sorting protein
VAACVMLLAAPVSAQPNADELMRKNFQATKVSGFIGEVTMVLTSDRGEQRLRNMSIRSKLKGNGVDSAVMTRFVQPADIKGTGFLQIEDSAGDDNLWVYLPALGKTRRLTSNNKRDSFFGTDFSYGDILLPAVDKYRHALLRTEPVDGADCYVIESRPLDPKTRDDTGYDRKVTWIDSRNYVERKVEYYDTGNAHLKTQLTFDVREVEPQRQRWLPMRREMTNHQTGHKTLYRFDSLDVNNSLADGWFNVRNLES